MSPILIGFGIALLIAAPFYIFYIVADFYPQEREDNMDAYRRRKR